MTPCMSVIDDRNTRMTQCRSGIDDNVTRITQCRSVIDSSITGMTQCRSVVDNSNIIKMFGFRFIIMPIKSYNLKMYYNSMLYLVCIIMS